MTKTIKRRGGSYVADNGKIKKVEGTQEPDVAAPRDGKGKRLDRLPEAEGQKPSLPNNIPQGGNVARNSEAALSDSESMRLSPGQSVSLRHDVGPANTGTKTKRERIKK